MGRGLSLGLAEETASQKAAAKAMGLEAIPEITDAGTFLHPGVEDETEDWGHRGKFLLAYRELKKAL